MILDDIVAHKRLEIAARKKQLPQHELEQRLGQIEVPRNFLEALRTRRSAVSDQQSAINHKQSEIGNRKSKIAIVAECKRSSPSRGVIRDPYDPVAIARSYETNGAAAISVLTDEKYFGGSLEHLDAVHRAVTIPVLRKEFIFDEYQIFEGRAAGADAVLLIAAILDRAQLRDLIDVVWALRMHALVEVHDPKEIERAAESNTGVIGVNNRDLDSLEVDIRQTAWLMPLLPAGVVVVSESGIRTRDDLAYLRGLGVHAVLIGERFMSAADPGKALAELMGER
jgi:indole-3-glycerol phosphate synthase